MLKTTIAVSLSIILSTAPQYVLASDDTCEIHVAVSSPPVLPNNNVAFNVTNDNGLSKSIILQGGSAPKTIGKLICSSSPYTVSATMYSTPQNSAAKLAPPIGQCSLRAGNVILNGPNNSVAVVFPNDFNCNQ
ncbi:hypothetical protein [Legionella fallonii]|uniref:Uncharacterized protein n=1 Tax=Legionella fallonii LLAP-10 TaxID=1212491 RepID=A0A098G0C5_9GAMM|nr:hypothetical protein [Legionella fallonii]CEG55918.1 conserved exported protein of unknown function [Legionella fallonii LLAP-10]